MLAQLDMLRVGGRTEAADELHQFTRSDASAVAYGNTTGMPPRTGLEPSKNAFEETKSRSIGSELVVVPDFQEITEAPTNPLR